MLLAIAGLANEPSQYDDFWEHSSVVRTFAEDSWGLPTFGERVVAALKPQAFVDDDRARTHAVDEFLSPATSNEERRDILREYDVEYVLLRRSAATSSAFVDDVEDLGRVVEQAGQLELIRVQ